MQGMAVAKVLLLLTIIQFTIVHSQADQEIFVFDSENENNVKLSQNQKKKLSQEQMTFRSMVRAQNLAKAEYNNERYGNYFRSGETIFTSYTSQQFLRMYTGAILDHSVKKINKPSKGSIRNLQDEENNYSAVEQEKEEDSQEESVETQDLSQEPIPKPPGPFKTQSEQPVEQVKKVKKNKSSKYSIIGTQTSLNTEWKVDWSVATLNQPRLVTAVKNQGQCGSCWAFSATAEMEAFLIRTRPGFFTVNNTDLAEQQCAACGSSYVNSNGCLGGYDADCYIYARNNFIVRQADLPYLWANTQTGTNSSCKTTIAALSNNPDKAVFRVNDYRTLIGCQAITDHIFKVGPIQICTYADDNWQGYKSGTIIPSCKLGKGGHCYLLVGANVKAGSNSTWNFWKFKNSWSTGWGEQGYFRATRNDTDMTNGYCNMCRSPGQIYTRS